jgi:DNA-binding SARP family transcriptional activator
MKTAEPTAAQYAYVTMLGGFSITVDGQIVSDEANRTHKLWNVLAYLVAHRGRMVPQAEFIEQFWPDEKGVAPANALKTQLYRIRAMLQPLFHGDFQPILSQRGGYEWNPAIQTEVDVDMFFALCLRASKSDLSVSRRKGLLEEALALYRGDFLPKLSGSGWVLPIAAEHHRRYLETVISYTSILEEEGLYEDMVSVAQDAIDIDCLDETLHTILVRGLLHQGKHTEALAHYEYATDLLYRHQGAQQWKELRALYDQIMATEQAFETDLSVIQQDLRETAQTMGAFFCEYGFFREIYRLEARRCVRSGIPIHIALITVSSPDGGIPDMKNLNKTMDNLQNVIAYTLRSGDVVARYSGAQFVIMLPAANLNDSEKVIGRVLCKFRRRYRLNQLKISSRIRGIELMQVEMAK